MVSKVQCRVAGYGAIMLSHLLYAVFALRALMTPKCEELEILFSIAWGYLTLWNLVIQFIYAVLGLYCDIPLLMKWKEGNNDNTLDFLRWYRSVLLYGIVWPVGVFVYVAFWSLYLYDRQLHYPVSMDTVLSSEANHLMHTSIIIFFIWEFIFAERRVPQPDMLTFQHITGITLTYHMVSLIIYYSTGHWNYELMRRMYGSIYMIPFYLCTFIIVYIAYFIQWYIPATPKINLKQDKTFRN